MLNGTQKRSYPCSTLVLGLWPETDSELSASEGTTAKNLQGIINKVYYYYHTVITLILTSSTQARACVSIWIHYLW